jgi:hypothetical protein
MTYLAPEPVKDLEDWLLGLLRDIFPETVYVLIGYKEDEEQEAVPYDYVRIVYLGCSTNDSTTTIEQRFNFRVIYSCHLPATMLPHRRSLALLEAGRKAIWQKVPPRPADALPALLKSEKLAKIKDCGCGPVYTQDWCFYNKTSNVLTPIADPCLGANEPGSYIPSPEDYITPLTDDWYVGVNSNYDPNLPASGAFNQPYVWIDGEWIINPDYDPLQKTVWGNQPFVLIAFIKQIKIEVKTGLERLWNN